MGYTDGFGRSVWRILLVGVVCLICAVPVTSKPEWRCLWVDSWQPGFLTAEQCDRLLENARRYHFNTLFVEVRRCADAYYRSSLEPRAANLVEKDFDPLAYLITKGHQEPPVQIHAWVVVYRAWVSKEKRVPDDRQHVVHRHSEWIAVNRSGDREAPEGYYLDPGLTEVQDYLVAVMRDLMEKYDIDGLHLDYVRYPGADWGYGPRSVDRWRKATGRTGIPAPDDPSWCSWRREQVTSLVRRIYAELAMRRPGALLSPAAITWGGLEMGYEKSSTMTQTFQDWFDWEKEGIIDFGCPMNYKRAHYADQAEDFTEWIRGPLNIPDRRPLVVGLAGWLNTTENTLRQIEQARRLGAEGVSVFSYQNPTASPQSPEVFFKQVSQSLFRDRVQPPATPWKKEQGTLFGRIRGGTGAMASYRIRLSPAISGGEIHETTADSQGYFIFTRLMPNRYRLDAVHSKDRMTARATVTIQAGQGLQRDLRVPG